MKFRKILKYTWFPILLMAVFAWFFSPVTFLKGVDAAEVAYVEIFDGNTGDELEITAKKDIAHIVENVQSVPVRREGVAFLNLGYRFIMTFEGDDGTEIAKFTINDENTIRGEFFYYVNEDGGLCFDYLWHLMDEAFGYI
jgi:hypothetical protein